MPAPSLVYTDPEFSGVMMLDVKEGPIFFSKTFIRAKCVLFFFISGNIYWFLVLVVFFYNNRKEF